jgi:TonB family protein
MNHQTSMFTHETQIPRSPFASTLTLVFHAVLGLAVVIVTAIPSIPRVTRKESLTWMTAEPVPDLSFEVPQPAPVPKPPVVIPKPEPIKAFEAPAIEKPAPVPVPPAPAPEKKAVIEPPKEVPAPRPNVTLGAFDKPAVAKVERKAQIEAAGFEQTPAEAARVKRDLQALDAFNDPTTARAAAPKAMLADSGFGPTGPASTAKPTNLTVSTTDFSSDMTPRPAAATPKVAPSGSGSAGFSAEVRTRPAATAPGRIASAGFAPETTTKPAAAPKPVAAAAPVLNDTPPPPKPAPQAPPPPRADRPVEVLLKPAPAYTEEARARRIEGEVVLEVDFTADGKVKVLRVVRGLGYGLDEMAQRAAEQIRFKPATSKGSPVDFRANLTIVFRLT